MDNKNLCISSIKLHLHAANCLKHLSVYNINFKIWKDRTAETLMEAFGLRAQVVKRFESIKYVPSIMSEDDSQAGLRQVYLKGLEEAMELLQECINQLTGEISYETLWEDKTPENGKQFWAKISADVIEYLKHAGFAQDKQQRIITELEELRNTWCENNLKDGEIPFRMNRIVKLLNKVFMENEDDVTKSFTNRKEKWKK